MHHTPLIATIVAGLGLAFILGAIANRLRISPLVGYLLAGVLVGPNTPGFVADQSLANELAEIGVILLMFGVGLHFSLKDLLSVKAIAIPGAVVQIAAATVLGMGLAWLLGWNAGAGFVFGLALSVASTVVLIRALQERHLLETERGKIAVGWLIVEDLAMVLALVMIPAVAGALTVSGTGSGVSIFSVDVAKTLGFTLAKVLAFVGLMLLIGRRVIPWVLHYIAHTGQRELFRLAVLAIALGVAYGATAIFGVSFALGAFFAGMILSESPLSQRAAEESLPLRDAFAVLFFVSVGMLFDPMILVRDFWPVAATVFIIVFGKSLAAYLIVKAFRYQTGTALIISASLAQIGEFSFILAGLGVGLKILPEQGRDLILAGAILSILLNPMFFALLHRIKPRLMAAKEPEQAAASESDERSEDFKPTSLSEHAVLIGYGRVGSTIGESLTRNNSKFLVIEEKKDIVDRLLATGVEVIHGNALETGLLPAANISKANWLFVAVPDAFEAGQIVQQARATNSSLEIVARAHSDAEVEHLSSLGANVVVLGEREIGLSMFDQTFGSAK